MGPISSPHPRRYGENTSTILISLPVNPLTHMIHIKGYREYKRREFCKDVRCPVQLELDAQEQGSDKYEEIRNVCKGDCKYTTYQFHHWLIEKGYLIMRPETAQER